MGYAPEELYPDRLANHYEELAHHFMQGEAWEKAFDYLVLAGDKAKNAYAARPPSTSMPVPSTWLHEWAVHASQAHHGDLSAARPGLYAPIALPEAIAEAEHMRASARAAGDRQSEGEALADLALYHE